MADATEDPRFVKVYRTILTDEKFARVRADRAALGTWLLMLLDADAQWPSPASLPRWATDAHIELLASVELIVLDGEDRYRVKGLDAERAKQRAKAKAAADARWNAREDAPSIAPSNASSNAQIMPTQTQTKTETKNVLVGRSVPSARGARSASGRAKVTGFTAVLE